MKNIFKKIIAFILRLEARLVLARYKPKIIAITGSVGKTSTKDAVYAVLSKVAYVRKSEKSFNSEIGLPLTILGVRNGWNNPLVWFSNILKGLVLFLNPIRSNKYPTWLVLEVGVGHPGDMRRTATFLKTDVVIMTAIGETPVHIEFFNSRKNLIEEKSNLIKTLKKDGLLILNSDDKDILEMKAKTKNKILTYGFNAPADILGSSDNILYSDAKRPEGIIFRVDQGDKSFPVVIEGVFGRNHVYASLASLALALGLKLNIINAADALKNYEVPPGRMRLLDGIKGSLIIDDTYNSSPVACISALKTLGEIKSTGRKIAILGDMLELGKHTEEAHRNIGKMFVKENCNVLLVVGPRAQAFGSGALEAGMDASNIFEFLNSAKAGEFMKNFIQEDDIVLVKGSQGVRMERIIEVIMVEKENQEKLLVRQDKEWKQKAG